MQLLIEAFQRIDQTTWLFIGGGATIGLATQLWPIARISYAKWRINRMIREDVMCDPAAFEPYQDIIDANSEEHRLAKSLVRMVPATLAFIVTIIVLDDAVPPALQFAGALAGGAIPLATDWLTKRFAPHLSTAQDDDDSMTAKQFVSRAEFPQEAILGFLAAAVTLAALAFVITIF